jgi:hypothetical protein
VSVTKRFNVTRREGYFAWGGSAFAAAAFSLHPVNGGFVRLVWLATLIAFLVLSVVLWRRSRWPYVVAAMAIVIPAAMLVLPGRAFSRESLRAASVEQLRSFEGTRYIWGGESRLGIDCSGLVRQALIRSSLKLGLSSLNGDLVRSALALWWFDSSALALRDGYRGTTTLLLQSPSINAVPTQRLLPGDFAVTSDGIHVLAYLGDNHWIEADPELGRVLAVDVPTSNAWFGVPVHVLRWRQLAE